MNGAPREPAAWTSDPAAKARQIATLAVTEGVNLRYVETMRRALYEAADEIEAQRRALVAHHDIATLSDAVLAEYDFRECPVCRRAREQSNPRARRKG